LAWACALRAIAAGIVGVILIGGCASGHIQSVDVNSLPTQPGSAPVVLKWNVGVTAYEVTTFLDRLTFTTIGPGTTATVDDAKRTVSLGFLTSASRQAETTSVERVEASGLFEPFGASATG